MTDFQKNLKTSYNNAKTEIYDLKYKTAIEAAANIYIKVADPKFTTCNVELAKLNQLTALIGTTKCAYTTNKDEIVASTGGNTPVYSCTSPLDDKTPVYFFARNIANPLIKSYVALNKGFVSEKLTDVIDKSGFTLSDAAKTALDIFNLNVEARDLFPLYAAAASDVDAMDDAAFKLAIAKGQDFLDDIQSIIGCLDIVNANVATDAL